MGIDAKRFINPLPPDFICPICNDVFDVPVQCKDEHIFCKECISKWLLTIDRCPLDQNTICRTELIRAPRVVRNLLDSLVLRCDFSEHGCHTTSTLELMEKHEKTCKFRELGLFHEQMKELIIDMSTMGNNARLVDDALTETKQKLATATIAIDDLQVQLDNNNSKIVQLQTEFEKFKETSDAKLEMLNTELKKCQNVIAEERKCSQASASRTKHIAEITLEIAASLAKLANKLNE